MERHRWKLAALALLASCSGEPAIEGGRTNVLLVVIDTLRADHLGAYGYEYDTSPVLDRLAREGVQLDWFFSTSSWTRPGMATLFTGHYPRSVGIYQERFDALPPEARTLAERLSERGYRTVGITANPNLNEVFGFAQGFDRHLDAGVVWGWMEGRGGEEVFRVSEDNLDDAREITDRALAALDREADEGPFYMRLVYIDPHYPYSPPARHLAVVEGSPTPGYDGEVRHSDAQVGRLLAGLEERGLLDETLVIVTSDHGEGLLSHPGIPHSGGHGTTLYDSTTRIPLLLRHPALPAGLRLEPLTSSIQLVPTILDLLGWPVEEGELPGGSLAPLIRGEVEQLDLPSEVFSETDWRKNRKVSVRTREHRLIRNDDCGTFQRDGSYKGRQMSELQRKALTLVPEVELYEVGGQPALLKHNRAEAQGPLAGDLAQLLSAWDESTARAAPLNRAADDALTLGDGRVVPLGGDGEQVELDTETTERLRALGYLE